MENLGEDGRIKKSGVIIQGFDILDVTKYIARASKRKQATLLSALEEKIDRDSELFRELRKLILDTFNDFSRETIRSIFGDIEI